MDATLQQILAALFQAHATIDALQQQVRELEKQLLERIEKGEVDGIPDFTN